MKPVHSRIVFLSVLVLLVGCSAPPKKPSLTEGIRLKDLAPPDAAQRGMVLPPAVNLQSLTYVVPAAEYERAIRLAVTTLESGPGILKNAEDFHANGFLAATGGISSVSKIAGIMDQAGARLLSSNYYTVFDDKGDDIAMTTVAANLPLSYFRNGRQENLTVRPGQLVLRVVARRFTSRSSVFRLTVQPVWKPSYGATFIERTVGFSRDFAFSNVAIDTNMQAGDLVLVAPAATRPSTPNLAETLMTSSGYGSEVKVVIVMCTGISQ